MAITGCLTGTAGTILGEEDDNTLFGNAFLDRASSLIRPFGNRTGARARSENDIVRSRGGEDRL